MRELDKLRSGLVTRQPSGPSMFLMASSGSGVAKKAECLGYEIGMRVESTATLPKKYSTGLEVVMLGKCGLQKRLGLWSIRIKNDSIGAASVHLKALHGISSMGEDATAKRNCYRVLNVHG